MFFVSTCLILHVICNEPDTLQNNSANKKLKPLPFIPQDTHTQTHLSYEPTQHTHHTTLRSHDNTYNNVKNNETNDKLCGKVACLGYTERVKFL